MSIQQLPPSVLLRVLSFLDEESAQKMARLYSCMREAMRQRNQLQQLAKQAEHKYHILRSPSHDPLWLSLGDPRTAILFGEEHGCERHVEINTLFATALADEKTIFLTEAPSPATEQLRLCRELHSSVFRWENPKNHQKVCVALSTLRLEKQSLLRMYYQLKDSKNFRLNLSIFARTCAHFLKNEAAEEFKQSVLALRGEIDQKKWMQVASVFVENIMNILSYKGIRILAATSPRREQVLVSKVYLTLREGLRPLVVAGYAHVLASSDDRTLGLLKKRGINFVSFIPIEVITNP